MVRLFSIQGFQMKLLALALSLSQHELLYPFELFHEPTAEVFITMLSSTYHATYQA